MPSRFTVLRFAIGFVASAGISLAGYRLNALTQRGAIASLAVGSAVSGCAGWRGSVLLGAFFVSGSALTRLTRGMQHAAGGWARNERQVMANGGVAAAAALTGRFAGSERSAVMLAGSLAAATADTWATEIGSTSKAPPRMILSRRHVTLGTSGAVTARGHLGAVAGALVVGSLAALGYRKPALGVTVTLAGIAGATVDSVAGELIQARYWDPSSGEMAETTTLDGVSTVHASGWTWVDNDVVNLACTLTGAVTALALHELLCGTLESPDVSGPGTSVAARN